MCLDVCSAGAIEVKTNGEGFAYPFVDEEKCVSCGLCQRKCPQNNYVNNDPEGTFAAYARDKDIRKRSSSGGLFSVLAGKVIDEGGVVFGAGFDDDLKVMHKSAGNREELALLAGSKYVQSDTQGVYKKVKEVLDEGKRVLFCATPCQCSALRNYIGDRDGLILVDFLCHGVPSPLVWRKYLDECFKDVKSAHFRSKENGWEEFSMKIVSERGNYVRSWYTDPYMRIFFGNIALRQSCYDCTHKGEGYASDITVADFWGISKVFPEMNDDRGTSAVIVRTEKGRAALDAVKTELVLKECTLESIIQSNNVYYKSAKRPVARESFFADISSGTSFEELKKKYAIPMKGTVIFKLRAKRFVKKALYKLK